MAERLVMRDYVDGDAKLMPTLDLGTCAIAVTPGQSYTIAASYTSTVPTSFSVQYRLARGVWVDGGSSPKFDPADEYTRARWTMPPIPEGVTAVSFGLTLAQDGELVTDDYSLITWRITSMKVRASRPCTCSCPGRLRQPGTGRGEPLALRHRRHHLLGR